MVRSHLSAVVISAAGNGNQLPDKEQIAPNQLSWPETAKQMGVQRGNKKHGKVDSAHTAVLIGEINRKHTHNDEDPYGAGEQSGKHAKPDARSVAANTRVCVATEPRPARPVPPPSSLPARSSSPRRAPSPTQMPPHYPPLLPLSQPVPGAASSFPPSPLPHHPTSPPQIPPHVVPGPPLLPLSQPATRPASSLPPASLPPHMLSAHAPGHFPSQALYYPPPFLSQPAQLTQYHPGIHVPHYPLYYAPQ
ncbi:hypothetical protein V8E53_005827 [Lactarius tabidus]